MPSGYEKSDDYGDPVGTISPLVGIVAWELQQASVRSLYASSNACRRSLGILSLGFNMTVARFGLFLVAFVVALGITLWAVAWL